MTSITLIRNPASGTEKDKVHAEIEAALAAHASEYRVIELCESTQAACHKAVVNAASRDGLVIAAGGDGTVNAVAALCHEHGARMAVIPLGTFNYFAREMLVPLQPLDALEVALTGVERSVAVGFAADNLFLNNASFGIYSTLIRKREQASSRFGRMRFVAAIASAIGLLQGSRRFNITLTVDGHEEKRTTSLVFVGNNTLQLDNLGLEVAKCTRQDRLAVVIMKRTSRWQMIRILFRSATKTLKNEDRLDEFCLDRFSVDTKRHYVDVVIDGEIMRCKTPLAFEVKPASLRVIVPKQEQG